MPDDIDNSAGPSRLYLMGAFALRSANGQEYTPKNRKAQAILAMLALSPRGTRTRAWLRNKLWSESDEHHSASCLRQTLFELRKTLGEKTGAFLELDRQVVGIRFDRLWVDVRALTDNPGLWETEQEEPDLNLELLEGMDINDEEFEEWLMMERSAWREKLENRPSGKSIPEIPSSVATQSSQQRGATRPVEIGLMPSIIQGNCESIQNLGDFITESVAASLAEFQNLKIVDFQVDLGTGEALRSQQTTDFLIRTRVLGVTGSVTITFLVYDAETLSLLSSSSVQFGHDEADRDGLGIVNHFIGQNIDRLAKTVQRQTSRSPEFRNDQQSLIGYSILSGMFDLDREKFAGTVRQLERVCEDDNNTLFKSLLAYSSSFALGENLGDPDPARLEYIDNLANETLHANPFNSISLACLGHVFGYVLNNHELAAELFNRAIRLNPMQAFVWDHLALHKLYNGDLDGAREASSRAVFLGTYSPINYTYETTSCMISSLSGDHRRAVHLGKRALAKQPNFNAAIRYSLSSCGHLNAHKEAELLRDRLLKSDPDFVYPEVQRNRFRLPLPDASNLLLAGIKKAVA